MKINKLKLRGAIGIKKGLGLDEIEIDFTQFTPGLVALTGKNGNGKTTIMENLHPYRRLVSREGAIENHFCLKHSRKELEFEVDGTTYKSILEIDGITGASEAYLYKASPSGWDVVTNKDKKPYDAAIESILGSEDLFFNSVFSAQKSKGIAQLKAGERRKLFYELLNLNTYESLCEKAKEGLKNSQVELAKIESEISTLMDQTVKLSGAEDNLESLLNEKQTILDTLADFENVIKSLQDEIRTSELELVKLQEKAKQNSLYAEDISKKTQEKFDLGKKCATDMDAVIDEKNQAILNFEISNEYKKRIEDKEKASAVLGQEEVDAQRKIIEERDAVSRELVKLQNDLQDNEKLLFRAMQLSNKKEQYAAKLEEKKEIEKKIADLQQQKTTGTETAMDLQNEEKKKNEILSGKKAELSIIKAEISQFEDKISAVKKQKEDSKSSHDKEVERIKTESAIISEVPCGDIGKSCQFLSRAYKAEESLPQLEKEFCKKWAELQQQECDLEVRKVEKETARNTLLVDMEVLETEIEVKFNQPLIVIRKNSRLIDSEIASHNDTLKDLGQWDWEKLNLEAREADTQKKILTEKISGIENSVAQLQESIKQHDARKEDISKQYKEKKAAIEDEIASLRGQQTREKAGLEEKYQLKRDELKNRLDQDVERINKEIKELDAKIDLSLNDNIASLEVTIKSKQQSLAAQEESLKSKKEELPALERQIAQLQADIALKEENEKKIEARKAELSSKQQEVKEYAFLVKAFDKTGIPVLKLENSGIEITSVANDLLSIFENKFRIVFETTRLKADGKSSKETFDINIVEDDGVCEISNKSGGQQVWLETAIQLAISLVVRQQGRNIQTSFLDEKDGALDLENAYAYIEMLRQAHKMSGVHNTFIITHRPELLDFIPQQISLKDGILEVLN